MISILTFVSYYYINKLFPVSVILFFMIFFSNKGILKLYYFYQGL